MKPAKVLIQEYILARTICVYYSDNLVIYGRYMCSKVALIHKCSKVVGPAIDIYNERYGDELSIAHIDVTSSLCGQIELEIIIDTRCFTDVEIPVNTEIVKIITGSLEKQCDPFESDEGLVLSIILI